MTSTASAGPRIRTFTVWEGRYRITAHTDSSIGGFREVLTVRVSRERFWRTGPPVSLGVIPVTELVSEGDLEGVVRSYAKPIIRQDKERKWWRR